MVQRAAELQYQEEREEEGREEAGVTWAIQDGLYACCSSREEAAVDCLTWTKLYSQQVTFLLPYPSPSPPL